MRGLSSQSNIFVYMANVTKNYKIEGMHCGACSTGVEMFLGNTEGVISAKVDYKGKHGVVEYDDAKINDQAIIDAIKELGYSAATG